MSTNVVMPQLGESVVEGTVGKWFKKVGDKIEQYEPIMEVITDKVTTEVPSPASGTLTQILVPEGTTVEAGTVLAVIGGTGEAAPSPSAPSETRAAPKPAPTPTRRETPAPAPTPSGDGGPRRLTPVVARMISEHNITEAELGTIQGSGEGGRISKKDLENYIKTRGAAPPQEPPLAPWEQPGTGELFRPTEEVFGERRTPPAPAPPPAATKPAPAMRDDVVPVAPMRKAIAEHMVRSKATSPHVTSVHEADMSRVIAYQKANEAEFANQGVKLTYTAFFVRAAVAALKAWPIVNASYTEQGVVMRKHINIGIAVALEDGLIVPVIKDADEKNLLGIARAVNDLATRARERKLTPEDVQGGTFTITNYGVFGSLFGTPIINQPQSAILGVGAIQKRAVVVDDAIAIRPMCYFSITIDHRLLDGAIGDQFMGVFKKHLEEHST